MMNGGCFSGNWESFLENLGPWGWIELALNVVFWVGLTAVLVVLVVWAVRRARVPENGGQPTADEILQAKYARGEINREQYQLMKQDIA